MMLQFARSESQVSNNEYELVESSLCLPKFTDSFSDAERVVSIYNNQQPQAIPPMKLVIYDELPSPSEPQSPSRMSSWIGDGKDLASRLSKRRTLLSRSSFQSSRHKRRKISAPTDFRRVSVPGNRRLSFRPLELSIYMPGNQLPELPEFSLFELDSPIYPPRATLSPTRNSYSRRYSDTPSAFSVPRKPVGSSRRRSSLFSDYGDLPRHRSTLSDSRLLRSMGSPPIYRSNSHNRSQSTPAAQSTSYTKPHFSKSSNLDEQASSPNGETQAYLARPASPPCSPLTTADTEITILPNTPPPRSDSLKHWFMHSPSSTSFTQQTPPTRNSSYDKRSRQISNSTMSSATTAASRRTPSLASSMTSAVTLYQPTPFRNTNDNNYELVLDNAMKNRIDSLRYEEVYPTIHESGHYRFSPSLPSSPRMLGANDIGVAV